MQKLIELIRSTAASIAHYAKESSKIETYSNEELSAFNAGYGKAMLDINMQLNLSEEEAIKQRQEQSDGEESQESPSNIRSLNEAEQ